MGFRLSGFPWFFAGCFDILNFSPNPARLNFMVFLVSGSGVWLWTFSGNFTSKSSGRFSPVNFVGKPSPASEKATIHQPEHGILKIRLALSFSDFHARVFAVFFWEFLSFSELTSRPS